MIFRERVYRDDQNLLRMAVDGNSQAAKELVHMLSTPAYSLAWKMLNDKNDAEDVVQEAFIRLWKSAPDFSGKSRLLTYFYSIVRNLCLDKLRSNFKNSFEEYDELEHSLVKDVEFDNLEHYQKEDLQIAFAGLGAKQRMALMMWVYEEKTAQQIGQVLGMNKNAVDQLLHRAKATLKNALEKCKGN